jgi:pimeloyl-ACP methyl ester carboxylesterase
MPPVVEGAGVPLAYEQQGDGPPVLLVHGLASDGRGLAGAVAGLEGTARVIAYDRRGYGGSGAPDPYTGTTVMEQAEDAAALLRELDVDAAVVAGEGFGALIALDLLRRHAAVARAAVLADPPLFAFVPEATEALAARRLEVEEALRERGPEAGVEAWLAGRLGGAALERARASHRGFYADFAGLASWPVTRRELRAVAQRAVVLTGPSTPPLVRMAADRLGELLPAARRAGDGDLAAAVRSLLA